MAVNKERESNNNNNDKTMEIMMSFRFDGPMVTRVTIESDDETDTHIQNEEDPRKILKRKASMANKHDKHIVPEKSETEYLKRHKTFRADEMVSTFWNNIEEFPKHQIPIGVICSDDAEIENKILFNSGVSLERTTAKSKDKKSKKSFNKLKSNRRKSNGTQETTDDRVHKMVPLSHSNDIPDNKHLSNSKLTTARKETDITDIKVDTEIRLPRTKITSRRKLKKFPGKMDSMKKLIEDTTSSTTEKIPIKSNIYNFHAHTHKSLNETTVKTSDKKTEEHLPHTKIASPVEEKRNPEDIDIMKPQLQDSNITENNIHRSFEHTLSNVVSLSGTVCVSKATDENIVKNTNLEKTFGPHLYKMLEKISDNLLGLFPLLKKIATAKNTRPVNENHLQQISDYYNKSKKITFSALYSSVTTLILPFKEDSQYMESFFELSSRMAKLKNTESFSLQCLKILCSDMIQWTEHEMRLKTKEWRNYQQLLSNQQFEAKQSPQQIKNPTLMSMLANSPANANYCKIHKGNGHYNVNYNNESPVHTTAQRAYNVYNTSSSRYEDNVNNAVRNAQNVQNQPSMYNYQNSMKHSSEIAYLECLERKANSNQGIDNNNINSPFATSAQCGEHYVSRLQTDRPSVINVSSLPKPGPAQIQNLPWRNLNTSSVAPFPNQQLTPAHPPPAYPTHFPEKSPYNPLRLQRRPSMHQQSYPEIRIQQQEDVQAYEAHRARRAITPIQQRSLSRDSGIMTPMDMDGVYEQMEWTNTEAYDPSPSEDMHSSFNPMITCVSSLNPRATENQTSTCSVCGTLTNLTCMQCASIYYCTVKCQASDWNIHSLLCTKNVSKTST